jgi:hypothetical protein
MEFAYNVDRDAYATIREHELWRRNVLISLAELVGKEDPPRAVMLGREAVCYRELR